MSEQGKYLKMMSPPRNTEGARNLQDGVPRDLCGEDADRDLGNEVPDHDTEVPIRKGLELIKALGVQGVPQGEEEVENKPNIENEDNRE